MFGMTGSGKSALGNLLAGYDHFQSGDDTVPRLKQWSCRLKLWMTDGSLLAIPDVEHLAFASLALLLICQASVTNTQSVMKYEAPDRSLVVLLGQQSV